MLRTLTGRRRSMFDEEGLLAMGCGDRDTASAEMAQGLRRPTPGLDVALVPMESARSGDGATAIATRRAH